MTIAANDDPRWRELAEAMREPRSAPVTRSASSHGIDPAFAASVKHQLHKRDRRIEALEGEVRALRERLDTHERLVEIVARLDRLEASPPRSGLRSVV